LKGGRGSPKKRILKEIVTPMNHLAQDSKTRGKRVFRKRTTRNKGTNLNGGKTTVGPRSLNYVEDQASLVLRASGGKKGSLGKGKKRRSNFRWKGLPKEKKVRPRLHFPGRGIKRKEKKPWTRLYKKKIDSKAKRGGNVFCREGGNGRTANRVGVFKPGRNQKNRKNGLRKIRKRRLPL